MSADATSVKNGHFGTTRWSVVLLAGDGNTGEANAALSQLYCRYRYPLYAYVRRVGHSHADAEDLTQEFFARLLEKKWLFAADPARGRFRSFLLGALKHFLANEWRRGQTRQRGGGYQFLSFDDADAAECYEREPSRELPPDALYDRRWALTLLDRVFAILRQEYEAAGEGARFVALHPTLSGERTDEGYAALASQLGLTVNGVKAAVRRLRRRYSELLRAEVAETVGSRADIDAELQYLMAIFGKSG